VSHYRRWKKLQISSSNETPLAQRLPTKVQKKKAMRPGTPTETQSEPTTTTTTSKTTTTTTTTTTTVTNQCQSHD
jgi:hypothetical protein